MKTTYDILAISPTQWVLVDKTRIPAIGEYFALKGIHDDMVYARRKEWNNEDSGYSVGKDLPILAAYPKIEGVLLLPSLLWEKRSLAIALAEKNFAHPTHGTPEEKWLARHEREAFIKGYEAPGGYTKEQMEKAFNAGRLWQISDTAESERGIENNDMDFETLISKLDNPSPRALEIDVNEDGSIPSDNGTIIYNKAIY